MINKIGILSITLNFFFFSSLAQNHLWLNFRKLSQKNGLKSINVRKIVEDSNGFIWAGSQDGLYRYDGKDFVYYNKSGSGKKKITGPDIRDIMFVGDTAWVINSFGGIDAINTTTGVVFFSWNQQTQDNVRNVFLSCFVWAKNKLLVGGSNGLYTLDLVNKNVSQIKIGGLPEHLKTQVLNITQIGLDKTGNVWLFTLHAGVLIVNPENNSLVTLVENDSATTHCFRFIADNTVLSGTSDGIIKYEKKGNKILVDKNPFPRIAGLNNKIFSINKDEENNIWLATENNLLKIHHSGSTCQIVSESNDVLKENWMSSVFEIFFDKNNDLWIGCQEGMAYANCRPPKFTSFGKAVDSEVKISHSYFLYPFNDSIVYVCAEDGLYKTNTKNGTIKIVDKGKAYFYVYQNFDGKLCTSSSNGLALIVNDRIVSADKEYPEFRNKRSFVVNSHVSLGDSLFVFGTQNDKGILFWNYKKKKTWFASESTSDLTLKDNFVNGVYKSKDDAIWILTDKTLMRYNHTNKSIEQVHIKNPASGKNYSIFFDFCESTSNYYLASYGNGIVVLDKELRFVREISTSDGLSNDGIYKLFLTGDSLLIATSNNGLSSINLHDSTIKTYFENNGLQSNTFEELSGNIRNGVVYAGGVGGFTVVNSSNFSINPIKPELYISNISIKTKNNQTDTSNLSMSSFSFPNNVLQVSLHFSAINFSNPEKTLIKYRVKEQGNNWSEVFNNSIQMIGIAPGKYTLLIQAFNEDGIASEIKELTLIFLPKWYQTWWFKTVLVLAILAICYALYRIRINQLKKEEQIRNQIASDLHDDLGSTLNSVKVYSNLAMMEKENIIHLEKIKESTQDAIGSVRDLIWVLDDKKDSVQDLLARICQFAIPLCNANHIRFVEQINDEARHLNLGKEEKRNLYMILKESVNNSIKYAECRIILLRIETEFRKLKIIITDDGTGFELSTVKEGNGLKNMRNRAKAIKYSINITGSPGQGTEIRLNKN